jgi:F-type H+-transporting ATPase subunit b
MINLNFTLVLQILSFAILLAILNKVLFKPLMKYLDERADRIDSAHKEAEEARAEAMKLKASHEELLNEARVESERIRSHAEEEAHNQARKIQAEARDSIERSEQTSREMLSEEVRRAKEALASEVGILATEISRKILREEIDQKKHEEIIRDHLKQSWNLDKQN